jgi:pyruvate kinase
MLGENKGINLPGIPVKVPSLTEKDEEDLIFAVGQGVDAVAVSFVRTADDVRHVRRRLDALKSDTWIIAKLEKPQAVEHLDSILEVADGIMVARGDLGVEVPPEKVPAIQKHIIRRAAEYRKPVITATQMLESMIENPRPTRAEASDVANAIYDGTDAVMLSAETAAGKYPVETVAMMAKIVAETEHQIRLDPPPRRLLPQNTAGSRSPRPFASAWRTPPKTSSSRPSRSLPRPVRPRACFRSITPNRRSSRCLRIRRSSIAAMLLWGTFPILCHHARDTDKLVGMAEGMLKKEWLRPSQSQVVGIVPARGPNPAQPTSCACT